MTLAQLVQIVRRRHNAVGDDNWSDSEIYELITNRCNEALSYIGLIEAKTTATSTTGTQAYTFPTNTVDLWQVDYDNERLKRITFEQAEAYRTTSGWYQGTPNAFFVWDEMVYLVPTPDDSKTIQYWYRTEHPYIDGSTQTTVDIPSVLHGHLANGVIADMYAKDLNSQMAQYYETKWNQVSIPAFQRYRANYRQAGQFNVTGDSDNLIWYGY